jgi:hypothetical protein
VAAGAQAENEMAKDVRMQRRMLGMLSARLPEARLDRVRDPRSRRGRRRGLGVLLTSVVAGIAAGCKSLMEAEALSAEMSAASRRRLGMQGRLPDTTMRDTLVRLAPSELRRCLWSQAKAAHQRRALVPVGLPLGVLAIDGKSSTCREADDHYAQRQTSDSGHECGLVRTMTCSLVSSASRLCLDAIPIPAQTNEAGHFAAALESVHRTFKKARLFELVSYDSGACSVANAALVIDKQLHYLFGLKENQPTLAAEARRLLGHLKPDKAAASSIDVVSNNRVVTRRLYLTEEMAAYMEFPGLRTLLRVESETHDATGAVIEHEDRYLISSLPLERLSHEQWLLVVRRHWAIENNCHHTWDTAFREDERPWIEKDPQGMLVVTLLRRVAYNMLALFRSVTQRSEERRATPWKDLLRWMYQALFSATAADSDGLRTREVVELT